MLKKIHTLSIFSLILMLFSCNQSTKNKTQENKNSSDKEVIIPKLKQTQITNTTSDKIIKYLTTSYLDESDLRVIPTEERRFQYTTIDLNGDGTNEVFVYLNSKYFCGSGGCTFLLLDKKLNLITEFTVTRAPILVSNTIENGWKKLYLMSDGYREIIYNTQNKSYPTNPSIEKEVKEDVTNQKGVVKLFESENNINF